MTQARPHRDEWHALPGKLQEGPHSGRVRRQPQPPRLCHMWSKPDRALPSSSKPPSPRRARGALLLKVLLWVYSKCAAGGTTSRRGAGRARRTHRMAPRRPKTMTHAQEPQRAAKGIHRIRKTTAHRTSGEPPWHTKADPPSMRLRANRRRVCQRNGKTSCTA